MKSFRLFGNYQISVWWKLLIIFSTFGVTASSSSFPFENGNDNQSDIHRETGSSVLGGNGMERILSSSGYSTDNSSSASNDTIDVVLMPRTLKPEMPAQTPDDPEPAYTTIPTTHHVSELEDVCGGLCRKCCAEDYLINKEKMLRKETNLCVPNSDYRNSSFTPVSWTNGSITQEDLHKYFELYVDPPSHSWCNFEDPFYFLLNYKKEKNILLRFYCSENVYESGNISGKVLVCYKHRVTWEHLTDTLEILAYPLTAINVISMLFPVLLIIMYLRSSTRSNLHIRTNVAILVSFILENIFFIANYLKYMKNYHWELYDNNAFCAFKALADVYSLLMTSFWVNIICYDITRILRGSLVLTSGGRLKGSTLRFVIYCCYCCVSPLIICLVALAFYLIETTPSSIKPVFEPFYCNIEGYSLPFYLFSFGPRFVLFIVNAVFMIYIIYLLTSRRLMWNCCRKNLPSDLNLRTHSTQNNVELFKQRLFIYIVLLLTWICQRTYSLVEDSDALKTMQVVFFNLETFKGIGLFLLLARTRNWAILKETYENTCSCIKSRSKTHSESTTATSLTDSSKNDVETTKF